MLIKYQKKPPISQVLVPESRPASCDQACCCLCRRCFFETDEAPTTEKPTLSRGQDAWVVIQNNNIKLNPLTTNAVGPLFGWRQLVNVFVIAIWLADCGFLSELDKLIISLGGKRLADRLRLLRNLDYVMLRCMVRLERRFHIFAAFLAVNKLSITA